MSELAKYLPEDIMALIVLVDSVDHSFADIDGWNKENGIAASRLGHYHKYAVWYVKDDSHRIMFKLRWG